MAAAPVISYDTGFTPAYGRPEPASAGVVRLTAPNRGPFTFTGTNSYILGEARLAVVDPGPDDAGHFTALLAALAGRPVEAILLTHTHADHSALARRLQAATGAPLWFAGRHRLSRPARPGEIDAADGASNWDLVPDRTLEDGEVFVVAGYRLAAVATPGHCANHMCYGLEEAGMLLSGDHVMGWNSTLVSVPGGSMADYLASLRKLVALPYRTYLPGHGGPVADGPGHARALLVHRELRNLQVAEMAAKGAETVNELLGAIYPHLAEPLLTAARMVLDAHVEYLGETGKLALEHGSGGTRFRPR